MMKRLTITLFCTALLAWSLPGRAAMSLSEIRQNARFLSDRMAYELNLNSVQYGDVYEINYDFLYGIRFVMDGVVRGSESSIDRYYEYLDMRNEDLSHVLSRRQYLEFAGKEYFYRPVYTDRNVWRLRIYGVYSNTAYFYFSVPVNFYTYNGIRSRSRYHGGYYHGRYHHDMYHGPLCRIREHKAYADHRWHDFRVPSRPDKRSSRYEPVRSRRYDRPNGNGRPNSSVRPDKHKRPEGHGSVRPDQGNRPNQNNRPNSGNSSIQRGNRFHSGDRPDSNVRSNRSDKDRPRQIHPNGASRSVLVNSRSDREKKGATVFVQDTGRNRSGASRK